jgi:hypothetical protein
MYNITTWPKLSGAYSIAVSMLVSTFFNLQMKQQTENITAKQNKNALIQLLFIDLQN